jgi:hypothetical protein
MTITGVLTRQDAAFQLGLSLDVFASDEVSVTWRLPKPAPIFGQWEGWWGFVSCRPDAHVFMWASNSTYEVVPDELRCCCGAVTGA